MFQINLTVGEVAGLISGCISLLHIVIPLLFAFVLVGIVRDRSFDAVTWSSISHLLQSSWWPLLLQSDGAAGNFMGKMVRWRVFGVSLLVTLATICLVVANFLTPKPLLEKINPSSGLHDVEFFSVTDPSYYGMATLELQGVNRRCGWQKWMDCPHSIYDDPAVRNQYVDHTVINSTIPDVTREVFTSGTKIGTVANLLDIEFRAYNLVNNVYVDNNATRAVGRLEVLPSMILNQGYHLVNGLIIDAYNGGIGIRNHTVPGGLELGATWTEDILWVIPETRCTNTNLSLHFSVNGNASSSGSGDDGYLRDDGGFSDISPQIPLPAWNDGNTWKDVGSTPQLKRSADILAWWNNQFVAQALNLTDSEKGAIYRGQLNTFGYLSEPGAIKISSMDGMFLDDIYYKEQTTLESEFENYGTRCSGYYDDDPSVDGKAFMQCGYLYSIPQPENVDQGQSWRPDPGSPWQQNLYTCASSVAATVKQVTFSTNGSTSLEALQVIDVQEKAYNSSDLPLWGVEKVDPSTYKIWDVYKFWGLIDESLADHPDVVAQRAAKIYLPAAVRGTTLGIHMYDSFAAGGVFTAAWNSIYSYAAALSDVNENAIPNYSGKSNYGLTLKWRDLMSRSAGSAGPETLMNLIWTDLISFAIVGTRTGFEGMGTMSTLTKRDSQSQVGLRPAHKYERSIAYGDLRYAIPAFIVGAIFLLTLVVSLGMCCFQPRMWRALAHYTRQTSMGRAVTQTMLKGGPDEISADASTKHWAKQARYIILPVPPSPSGSSRRSRDEHKTIGIATPSGSPSIIDEADLSRLARIRATLKPGFATSRSLNDYGSQRSQISYTAMVDNPAHGNRGPSWRGYEGESLERLRD
ncbi:uncharacterized protein Z520_01651 [Fonsecaea multimorphosa CBS 102226]|uniref:Uncharacterized protein n=1 Tax=Fonsecaea multimorphosa CBS 102226 TaxID=1442371 RepID=A0A0D2L293_9EURO|nr:uncharacterized protein Z520_01651 [Fonsecaea multimorphosa CBS 102226]KIY03184.1 hypothetical protein Z520_01651 [Fonsecaea multimorphosa CBS 102226]OAL30427.1 hypothetical protein AYO22_01625 [Fonsecaea multimorphosa]